MATTQVKLKSVDGDIKITEKAMEGNMSKDNDSAGCGCSCSTWILAIIAGILFAKFIWPTF